jgi:hypothetical protein
MLSQQESAYLRSVQRPTESARSEARWRGAEPPTEQELQEMKRKYEESRNGLLLVNRAFDGRTGLALDDRGRPGVRTGSRWRTAVERQPGWICRPKCRCVMQKHCTSALRGGAWVGRFHATSRPRS